MIDEHAQTDAQKVFWIGIRTVPFSAARENKSRPNSFPLHSFRGRLPPCDGYRFFLLSAASLLAQLPAPCAAGVSAGHIYMMVRDPEAHKKICVDALGAQAVNSGSLDLLKLPGIFLSWAKRSLPKVRKEDPIHR